MDQKARAAATSILSAIDELDYAAGQFCELMLAPREPVGEVDRHVEIKPGPSQGDLLVTCHRVRCIAKYVHVLDPQDGKNGLVGQYKLFTLTDDGKPGAHIFTLQFDRHGNTNLQGNAESMIVQPAFQSQSRKTFSLYFVDAIQRSLEKPQPFDF